ncbi:hypothetical protein ACLB2K_052682 [Fragaria x ananassa]
MAHGRHGTDPPRDRTAAIEAAGTAIGHESNAMHTTNALLYAETPNNTLVGFADVGYLSDPHKERSQTGYVFTIGNTTISWRSTKQTLVATSSNHAEIIVLHEAIRECIWLRSIIKHIRGTNRLNPTTDRHTCIYEDNAACIEQMKLGYIKGDNTKHISPKFFYNQQQTFLNIQVNQVSYKENAADLFTKSLPKSTFEKHVKSIGMRRLSSLFEQCSHQGEYHLNEVGWSVVLFFSYD